MPRQHQVRPRRLSAPVDRHRPPATMRGMGGVVSGKFPGSSLVFLKSGEGFLPGGLLVRLLLPLVLRYCSRFVKRPRGESGADSASLASKFAWNRSTFFLLTSTQTNSAVYTWSQGLFPFDVLCVASHISDAFKEWQHNIVQTLIYWNLKTILCSCNIKLSPEQIVNP
ncbi:uncharacterized protein [Lolium perenne]|uniref:uncharacterized protein isoform X2 n=1 Tax=Lolium perenne TaxID=4522 RepID=UPI003A9A2AF6